MKIKLILFCFLVFTYFLSAQEKPNKYQFATVAFYNVENLFDTISSVDVFNAKSKIHQSISLQEAIKNKVNFSNNNFVKDSVSGNFYMKLINNDEFTPNGTRNWTLKKYKKKIENISFVLASLGVDLVKTAPTIIGLAEIENEYVLRDLVSHPYISHYSYQIVHHNSFDARGIECAFLYQPNRFKITSQKTYKLELQKNQTKEYTRDVLLVSGKLDGEAFSFIVNHWPSRRGGEKASEPGRIQAAELVRTIMEEIKKKSPNEKIVVMGDFNDNPTNKSIKKTLLSKAKKQEITPVDLFNPMESLAKKGYGTTAFNDNWFLFDQLLVNDKLVNSPNLNEYQLYKAEIFEKSFLKTAEGKYKNYPKRSFEGDVFNPTGFSDHFPVYLYLYKKFKE